MGQDVSGSKNVQQDIYEISLSDINRLKIVSRRRFMPRNEAKISLRVEKCDYDVLKFQGLRMIDCGNIAGLRTTLYMGCRRAQLRNE